MGNEIFAVSPTMLKEHKKASALIPEMTEEEWDKFFLNVQKEGIRQPLDINTSYEVLDGRHRLKAALKLGLNKIEVRQHDLTDDEAIRFVRDVSIEQKILTPQQKHKIFTDADVFIKDIYEKGKKKQSSGLKVGKKKPRLDQSNQTEKSHNTNEEIGKSIGMSGTQVKRMNKIKRENPDLYEEVVQGNKAVSTAYKELPTVVDNYEKDKTTRKNEVKNNVDVPKREVADESKPKPKPKQFNQQPPDLTPEQIEEEMFDANVTTFFRHLQELEGFIGRTKRFKEVVEEAIKRDSATMTDYAKALEETINLIKMEVL